MHKQRIGQTDARTDGWPMTARTREDRRAYERMADARTGDKTDRRAHGRISDGRADKGGHTRAYQLRAHARANVKADKCAHGRMTDE